MNFAAKLLYQIANHRYRHAALVSQHTAQTSARRVHRDTVDMLNDAVDRAIAALREKRVAEAERDCAVELVRYLSEEREAYRRLVEQLRQGWQPIDSSEPTCSEPADMQAWFQAITRNVVADPAWTEDRNARLARALQDAREHAQ